MNGQPAGKEKSKNGCFCLELCYNIACWIGEEKRDFGDWLRKMRVITEKVDGTWRVSCLCLPNAR